MDLFLGVFLEFFISIGNIFSKKSFTEWLFGFDGCRKFDISIFSNIFYGCSKNRIIHKLEKVLFKVFLSICFSSTFIWMWACLKISFSVGRTNQTLSAHQKLSNRNWKLSLPEHEVSKTNSWKTDGVVINIKYLIISSCFGKFVGCTG